MRTRTFSAMALTALGLAAPIAGGPVPAGAASPHQVDPALLTPALNPSLAPYSCFETGDGITCKGGKRDGWQDEVTDILCGGHAVHTTGFEDVNITRWHDSEGRALKTSLQTNYSEGFTLPSGNGVTVVSTGSWHKHYAYPVPGEIDSRILTETGAIQRLRAAGQGVVFQDTGSVTYVPGFEYEVPSEMHGVHDRFGGPAWEDALCAALS